MAGPSFSYPAGLKRLVEEAPHEIAVVCAGRTLSRSELDEASSRLARVYLEKGAEVDDLITIALPNGLTWCVACMAAWKIGAIPNPLSPFLPRPELKAILQRADPALVVGCEPGEFGDYPCLSDSYQLSESVDAEPLADIVSSHDRALASGGSTGLPKLIIPNTPARYTLGSPMNFFAANMVGLVPGPLNHAIPFSAAWHSLLAGAKVVIMERFDALECLHLIEQHRVDKVCMVPTMLLRIAKLPESERLSFDVSSLQSVISVGAACPRWLMRFWIDWLGPKVMNETFGSSERIGGTYINGLEWLQHPGSVGKPVGGVKMKICDPETGKECAVGEMGEIFMIPPGGPGSSFRYIGAERSTASGGWESVGDMGYVDEDGYLYLGDRRSDMFVSGGRNIFPAELEAVLDEFPAVRSSAVIGLPDEDLGQRVHAIVEVSESVSVSDLKDFASQQLVYYKLPRTIEFVDYALRDDAGKVRRSALREARLHWAKQGEFNAVEN